MFDPLLASVGHFSSRDPRLRITMTCTGAADLGVLTMEHQPRRPGDVGRYPTEGC